MVKILQNLWILKDGLTVLNSETKKVDDQAFGMVMTALNSYAEGFSKGGMSNLEVSDMRFSILKKNDVLFIATSSEKVKTKKVMRELENIAKNFFQQYTTDLLDNWKGDISIFANFKKEIANSLEEKISKIF